MTRAKQHQPLFVYMNGRLVGILNYLSSGHLAFSYEQQWLQWSGTRPISLSLPLTGQTYKGETVYRFFDNLLPDNRIIRERIQKRFQTQSSHCFDLLSSIGKDCIGALQLLTEPIDAIEGIEPFAIQADKVSVREVATILKNYWQAPLGMMDNQNDFRISIAGAQEKTALLWHDGCWKMPKGMTPTSHIIKLPIGRIEHAGIDLSDSVENEWLCLKLLAEFGLSVADAKIKKFSDMNTLVVKRFDRKWVNDDQYLLRLPQEDCCQALAISSGLKYESHGGPGIIDIMHLLERSENFMQDRFQFMKTVFLFWVLGAIDGHGKNFSIFLHPQGRFELTPIYDVISAYPLADKRQLEWKKLKMAMAVKDKNRHYSWHSIQVRHWHAMAKKCHFPIKDMQAIIESIFDSMDTVIANVGNRLAKTFPEEIADSIFSGMRKIQSRYP